MDIKKYPFRVFTTVLLAFAAIQAHWRSLLVALVLPGICILIIETATLDIAARGYAWTFLSWAITTPFYALFAVVVHRTVILGSQSLPNPLGIFWSMREMRFVGWTFAIFLLSLLLGFVIGALSTLFAQLIRPSLVSMLLSSLLVLGIWLAVLYVYTRLSMVFPATAVDDATSFERAWQLTDRNGFRMIAVWILTVGPVLIVWLAVSYLMPASMLKTVVDVLLSFVNMFVGVCAASVIYRQLVRKEEAQFGGPRGGPPTEAPPKSPFDD